MRIMVLVVGKNRGTLAPAVREYEERASRYWKLEVREVDAGSGRGSRSDTEAIRRAEGRRLAARIPEGGGVWALTREGKGTSSEGLAQTLGAEAVAGGPGVTFLIGGAFGLDPELVRGADHRVSLSILTLPHAFARLLLAEQLYRAGTILRNEPYHKGAAE